MRLGSQLYGRRRQVVFRAATLVDVSFVRNSDDSLSIFCLMMMVVESIGPDTYFNEGPALIPVPLQPIEYELRRLAHLAL